MSDCNYSKTIAVDFDGCLHSGKWPNIGSPNWNAIHELIRRQAIGDKVILWSCRDGALLDEAILWSLNHGLKFDAVNENLEANTKFFGNNSRKIFANEYWDDRAVPVIAGHTEVKQGPEGWIVVVNKPERKTLFRRFMDWWGR